MIKKKNNYTNITISLPRENLKLLNKLCTKEHRKRGNQIIHMMEFYIEKNNLKL